MPFCNQVQLIIHIKVNSEMDLISILIFAKLTLLHSALGTPKSSYDSNKISWISIFQFKPERQREAAGRDADYDTFVGRVNIDDGQIVALYAPWWDGLFYPSVLDEIEEANKKNVQILMYPKGAVTWTRKTSKFSILPPNVLLAGFAPETGENVFVCRARRNGRLVPGQLLMSKEQGCLIIDENALHYIPEFEILSLSLYGIATNTVGDY